MKSQSEWSTSNKFVNVDIASMVHALPRLGIAEADVGGVHVASLSELIDLQLLGIDEPQQTLSPLIYPNSHFYIPKPLLNYFGDSALSSKVMVHPDTLTLTFMGTGAEMKNSMQFMIIPHFSRPNINEAEARSRSSTSKTQSALTETLKGTKKQAGKGRRKVKVKSSPKNNQEASRKRDLYNMNYSYACESLLSFLFGYRRCPKTAILSVKKSGPELPEFLSIEVSGGIGGIGLAILSFFLSKVADGRISFRDFDPVIFSLDLVCNGFLWQYVSWETQFMASKTM